MIPLSYIVITSAYYSSFKKEVNYYNLDYKYPKMIVNINLLKSLHDDVIKKEKYYSSEIAKYEKELNKTKEIDKFETIEYLEDLEEENFKKENENCEPLYINNILLVNKEYCINKEYNPKGLTEETELAYNKLIVASKKEDINFKIISGFRDYEYQVNTYEYWKNLYGEEYANTVSAKQGHSEHQTGMALDVGAESGECDLNECFENTKEGIWLKNNSYKYGFIIRYPKNKENITGYSYEPWHIRYVGEKVATDIFNQKTTLEEYLKNNI